MQRDKGHAASPLGRRPFVLGSAAVAGAGSVVAWRWWTHFDEARRPWRPGPFGPLRPDPDGVLDLPEGFSYRVLDRAGAGTDDGLTVPGRPDGMACFTLPDGRWSLLRNHELPSHVGVAHPTPAFDPAAGGGVSRLVIDPSSVERVSANHVLAGTVNNCAGGVSPWGWLSCEETVERGHGFVFVCDPRAGAAAEPRPVRGYGRFRHEAAVVDPRTNIAYLSEDREDSCFYRFVPHDPAVPFEGELQALRVTGRPGFLTGTALGSATVQVDWVPVHEPAPDDDSVRYRAQADGAAQVARGEGICLSVDGDRTSILVSASAGGPRALGQILELSAERDGGTLRAVATSVETSDFDMPDNVTVGPGGRVYFCEDGSGRDHVRGLDARTGEVFDFARNALSDSELAGVCFSPDGSAMFLNLQEDGLTLAIRGAFA